MKIKRIPNIATTVLMLKNEGSLWVKTFRSNTGMTLLYTLDRTQHGELHHLSVSKQFQYPSWDEIHQAKEEIIGDIDVMMVLPKRRDYVNVQKNCFHLWEMPEAWNIL